MSKAIRTLPLFIFLWALSACTRPIPGSNPGTNTGPGTGPDAPSGLPGVGTTDLQLSVQVSNSGEPFNTEGQVINYKYDLSNNDPDTDFPGPLVITDDKVTVTCPDLNTIGNQDNTLDPSEIVSCTGTYSITQTDLDFGKVVNNASASLNNGATTSNAVTLETTMVQTRELILKTTADPPSYDRAGQTITFTYEIMNNGNVNLGPAQFTITDKFLAAPLNCEAAASYMMSTETFTCTATYTITQADLDSGSVTSNATASDGTTSSDATMVTVTKSGGSQPNPSGLTPGTTIQHTVIPGDWLMQIARCYGADYKSVRRANPQIWNPAMIWSGQVVSVPNIGSVGPIYDKPCVVFHTAVAGDTWESIAQQYNARVDILKRVNPGGLFTGAIIKVPINSAGGSSTQVPGTKRIKFPSGETSATETGRLTASGKVTYLVAGEMGQISTVTLITPDGVGAIDIYDPNGNTLFKESESAWAIWNGILPINGDYRIELASAAGITDQNYSLIVELTTPVGTLERVTNIRSESGGALPRKPVVYNGALYFGAYEEDGSDRGLWKYDGTSVSLVAGNLGGPFGGGPAFLTEYNGALYFEADGGDGAGYELWKYDGAAPPSLVYDIHKGPEGSNPAYLAVYNGELYFNADDGEGAGRELWKYDGTNPPSLVEDIWDGSENSDPYDLAVYNGELYFNADDGEGAGEELWKYDGTTPPSLVEDIWDGPESSSPLYLTVYNGALYFGADNGEGAGYELWKYDGTSSPSLAADIRSGPESSGLQDFAVYDGALYFAAKRDEDSGYDLWKYDNSGTNRVADFSPGYLAAYNGALYFRADGGDGAGMQLWQYTSP